MSIYRGSINSLVLPNIFISICVWLRLFFSGLWWYSQGNSWPWCKEGAYFAYYIVCTSPVMRSSTDIRFHILLYLFQPEDWDDEEDGEWTAPTIPNPEYKGPWKQKVWTCIGGLTTLGKRQCSMLQLLIWVDFVVFRKSRTPTTRASGRLPWLTTQVC